MKTNIAICTAAWTALLFPAAAFGGTYTFTRLNPGPGASVSEFGGGGINNNGVLVGVANSQIFTYNISANTYSYFNLFPADAVKISDAGVIAFSVNSGNNYLGELYNTNTHSGSTFAEPNAPQYTLVNGISPNGNYVAGYYLNSVFDQPGFLRNGNSYSDVIYNGPHGQIYIWDVNNSGDMVGQSSCCRAGVNFLDQNGVFTTLLDPLGRANNGSVYGLNDLGQAVGWYDDGNGGPIHGLMWQNGTSTALDYPGATRTVLRDINDSGVILGGARDSNGAFLFIATPNASSAPEPATCTLIGGALAAIALKLRRRT